jgi:hypothetical protein
MNVTVFETKEGKVRVETTTSEEYVIRGGKRVKLIKKLIKRTTKNPEECPLNASRRILQDASADSSNGNADKTSTEANTVAPADENKAAANETQSEVGVVRSNVFNIKMENASWGVVPSPVFRISETVINEHNISPELVNSIVELWRANIFSEKDSLHFATFIAGLELIDKVSQSAITVNNASVPIEIHIPKIRRGIDESRKSCIWWIPTPQDKLDGYWTREGCNYTGETEDLIVCECNSLVPTVIAAVYETAEEAAINQAKELEVEPAIEAPAQDEAAAAQTETAEKPAAAQTETAEQPASTETATAEQPAATQTTEEAVKESADTAA